MPEPENGNNDEVGDGYISIFGELGVRFDSTEEALVEISASFWDFVLFIALLVALFLLYLWM